MRALQSSDGIGGFKASDDSQACQRRTALGCSVDQRSQHGRKCSNDAALFLVDRPDQRVSIKSRHDHRGCTRMLRSQ